VSQWPAGIYRRAYIRTYAQAVGLDPDLVSREFLRVHPQPVDVAAIEEIASLADGSRGNGGPPMRLRNIMGSALGSFSWRRRPTGAEAPLPPAIDDTSVDFDAAMAGPGESPAEVPPADAVIEVVPAEPVEDERLRAEASAAPGQAQQPDNAPAPEAAPGLDDATQPSPDFQAVASLCTRFGQVAGPDDLPPLLRDSADILGAAGLIVWLWDPSVNGLRAGLLYGYSEKVRSQLPTVPRDADNATAAAFRSAEPCVIEGNLHARGALVIPLLTPDECAGVLAIELERGGEQRPCLRAVAAIIAAQLSHLAARSRPVEAQPAPEMLPAAVGETVSPRFRAHVGR
jgi:hypothetical protein